MLMKRFLTLAVVATVVFSCQKQDMPKEEPVSDDVLTAIGRAGFSKEGVIRTEGGYIVEGDILIDDDYLRTNNGWGTVSVAGITEHHHTTNLVKNLPRVIRVSISNRLPTSYTAALDEAIRRYNAETLSITFQRVNNNANISIVRGNGSFLAAAGFPTAAGEPHNEVRVNSSFLGNNPNRDYLATILAHEIGHCIGFRHTDYMNRAISCGGSTSNEGASTVGAIHIANTPQNEADVRAETGAGIFSFMLACIGSGQNRPFTSTDRIALNALY